ncbi:hypothetical protein SVAN01_02393 [Stagonosporopsis vannaccii]|nr:hypothetical protein SVAN01_02393 [Stagonosporopsis vannaccii]
MDNLEQSLNISSIASLFFHESSEAHSAPALSSPDMLPSQQFRAILPDIRRRRKLSQQSAVNSKCEQKIEHTTEPAPTPKGQSTISVQSLETLVEEPARKRYRVQQWLAHHARRLDQLKHGFRGHRDSMFEQADIEKELRLASQNANAIIPGPDGEPIDQRVIDHFFLLYPACGSDWRDSARWEHHQARCLQQQCNVCRSPQYSMKRSSSPSKGHSSPPARSESPRSRKSPTRLGHSRDSSLPCASWLPKSRKHKEKGNLPANKEDNILIGLFSRRRRQRQENSTQGPRRLGKRHKANAVIEAAIRRIQDRPVRCSTKEVLDPKQIPVPAVPDLKPADSSGFDLTNLTHLTGRPDDGCLLGEGRVPFPLSRNFLPPSPRLRQECCISPTPESLRLRASSPMSSEDGVFSMSPLASPTSSTANLQCDFGSTIRLVEDPSADNLRAMLDDLSHDVSLPRVKKRKQPLADRLSRRPAPSFAYPPTPPDSRHNSDSSTVSDSVSSHDFGVVPPSKAKIEHEASAERANCKTSDTTGSSLPECQTYVCLSEKRDRRWASTVKRT